MDLAYHAANAVSIVLFLIYGLLCLFADGMVEEFRRFGLSRYRRLTGVLEVLGAVGLAVGYAIPVLAAASAAGLAILMLLGVIVRLRVGDAWALGLPAALLLLVNAFIAVEAVQRLSESGPLIGGS